MSLSAELVTWASPGRGWVLFLTNFGIRRLADRKNVVNAPGLAVGVAGAVSRRICERISALKLSISSFSSIRTWYGRLNVCRWLFTAVGFNALRAEQIFDRQLGICAKYLLHEGCFIMVLYVADCAFGTIWDSTVSLF